MRTSDRSRSRFIRDLPADASHVTQLPQHRAKQAIGVGETRASRVVLQVEGHAAWQTWPTEIPLEQGLARDANLVERRIVPAVRREHTLFVPRTPKQACVVP